MAGFFGNFDPISASCLVFQVKDRGDEGTEETKTEAGQGRTKKNERKKGGKKRFEKP